MSRNQIFLYHGSYLSARYSHFPWLQPTSSHIISISQCVCICLSWNQYSILLFWVAWCADLPKVQFGWIATRPLQPVLALCPHWLRSGDICYRTPCQTSLPQKDVFLFVARVCIMLCMIRYWLLFLEALLRRGPQIGLTVPVDRSLTSSLLCLCRVVLDPMMYRYWIAINCCWFAGWI